jgi:uncharacterized membrane protein
MSENKSKRGWFQFRLSTAIALMLICGLVTPLAVRGFEESLELGLWMLGIAVALVVVLFALWRWIVGMSCEISES